MEGILVSIAPAMGALALASTFVLVSNNLTGERKGAFQIGGVILATTASYGYVTSNFNKISNVWYTFLVMDSSAKFFLTLTVVTLVYIGGGFYAIGVTEGSGSSDAKASSTEVITETPAASDFATTFDVPAALPENDTVFFEEMFTRFTNEIVADLPSIYEMPDEAVRWVERMIPYTVAGGKMNRGLAVLAVQRDFASHGGRKLSNKERIQSAALGWCLEFLQGFFLVADDVMDGSITRRGLPCWYRRPEVNLIAINDSFILESCVYKILKRYFGSEPCYMQLVDLFIEVTRQTELGQLMDLTSQPQGGEIDLDRFTIERYCTIVKYKTAFYSFYLPVAAGMIVSGVKDRKLYNTARDILCTMGEYFQIQDDYLDCYGTPEMIGKIGTDIQDNKCSWLVVQALARATPAQRRVLQENYGRHDDKSVQKVKALYAKMDLASVFHAYEEESYGKIQKMLNDVKELPPSVFEFLLKKIYKRSK